MSNEHVLMVEDDKLVLSLVTSKLRTAGYQVTAAESISKALHATANALPDLLLLDLTLLDGDPFSGLTDGFAYLRMLQRSSPDAHLAVVIYSVDDSPTAQARAQKFNVTALVPKSAPIGELLAVIRKALDDRKGAPATPPAEAVTP
jgi:DNA-binding response OmpR family regulator